jgi:LCP family protein required for cell wall assembly
VSAKKVSKPDSSVQKLRSTVNNRNQKNKKQRGTNLLIGLGLTGVAMVSAAAGALLALSMSSNSPFQQVQLSPTEKAIFGQDDAVSHNNLEIPELKRPINVLVLGLKVLTSDLKEKDKDKPQQDLGYHALVNSFDGLTDTMLLLRFDPENNKLTALSIPRDTRVNLEGYGYRKINAANDYGGPALAAQAVSNLVPGVNVDRYVRVNVQGIEQLINALGGINVYVPRDMKYNDFSQHFYVNLKKGEQKLDGEKALQFMRFRHDSMGDIGRIQRQQILMRALSEQALKPSTLIQLPKIFSIIQSHIDTNLTSRELMALSGFATKIQKSNIQMLMLPGDFSGNGSSLKASYWLPNEQRIKEIAVQNFAAQIDDPANLEETQPTFSEPGKLKIAIQDSLEDPEAVRALVRYLQEAGYSRVSIASNYYKPLSETKIIAQKGDGGGAAVLRANLGIGDVFVESTGDLNSDITIQIGEDWREVMKNLPTKRSEQSGN